MALIHINKPSGGTVAAEVFQRASQTSDHTDNYTLTGGYTEKPYVFFMPDAFVSATGGYIGYLMEGSLTKTGDVYTGLSVRNTNGNGGAVTIYVCAENPFV